MTTEDETTDWDRIWQLHGQVRRGQTLELTDEVRELLRRTGPTVAITSHEVERALANLESSTALVREIDRRVTEGSHRLMDALMRMYDLRDASDLEGASQQMRDILAVEVVPLYRDIAEGELAKLTRRLAGRGRDPGRRPRPAGVEPAVAEAQGPRTQDHDPEDWVDIRLLDNQRQRGQPVEFTEDVRALLRRVAPTVAISGPELEAALASPERSTALLGEMRRRITEGSRRMERALMRMTSLRDAGDLEGACRQMRKLLAVEVVPLYRDMAQTQLARLSEHA